MLLRALGIVAKLIFLASNACAAANSLPVVSPVIAGHNYWAYAAHPRTADLLQPLR